MRIFPILAAIVVSVLMYMAIFERDKLLGRTGDVAVSTATATDGVTDNAPALTGTPAPSQIARAPRALLKVRGHSCASKGGVKHAVKEGGELGILQTRP